DKIIINSLRPDHLQAMQMIKHDKRCVHLSMYTNTEFNMEKDFKKQGVKGFFSDLKSLVKGIVLIANVLPILSGFWLALYFTDPSFIMFWDKFLYMLIGGTLLMAGALMLNNWYEVDLDENMMRTQERPTVTGNFSLNTVLTAGIVSSILGMILLFMTTVEAAVYGFIGWFTYVVLYTFWSKRKYTLNTVIGSVSGAVTPLIGWAVITSAYHIVPILLSLLLFIWQILHTFLMILLFMTTVEAAVYGFIGWFTYVVLYTFWSKRKYTLNTVIGSVSGAVTPLIGWAVITSAYHIVPILLSLMLFIWQIPHTFAI